MNGRRLKWVKCPTGWIAEGGLTKFKWGKDGGPNIAALIVFIVIAQNAESETGEARLTYDQLEKASSLSRGTIAAGLRTLRKLDLIKPPARRSIYALNEFGVDGRWAKLPCRALYHGDAVPIFKHFNLRRPLELHALKVYLYLVARRNSATNQVNTTYDKIVLATGIERPRIRFAISLLTNLELIHVDRQRRAPGDPLANVYRLAHIDPYNQPTDAESPRSSVSTVDA